MAEKQLFFLPCSLHLFRESRKIKQVMISGETLTVSLEEAIENHLLRSGNPAATSGGEDYWATVEKHVAAEDYTPLLGLVAELRDKIIGLTPRRRDLAAETSEAMDVELLEQMMDYGAFDVVRSVNHPSPSPPVLSFVFGPLSYVRFCFSFSGCVFDGML